MKMIQKLFKAGSMWFQPELPSKPTQLDLPFRLSPADRKPSNRTV